MYQVTIEHDEGSVVRILTYMFAASTKDSALVKAKREATHRGFRDVNTSISTELIEFEPVAVLE